MHLLQIKLNLHIFIVCMKKRRSSFFLMSYKKFLHTTAGAHSSIDGFPDACRFALHTGYFSIFFEKQNRNYLNFLTLFEIQIFANFETFLLHNLHLPKCFSSLLTKYWQRSDLFRLLRAIFTK